MVIFPIEEEKCKAAVEAVRGTLSEFGAEIEKEEPFGDRDLCYMIKKQNRGRYILFNIKVNPAKVIDIDGQFKLNQNVLKFLFVRVEE
jgi:small subunit ribosomal protein S6